MENTRIVIEVEDAAPTVELAVAYERFWKMVAEHLLREREANNPNTGSTVG
jgi:hypothetical protein